MIYFSEPQSHSKNKMKFESDLFNYAAKSDLKGTPICPNLLTKLI